MKKSEVYECNLFTAKNKRFRKDSGRAKQRRVELGLNQPYVADKMGVATSTIVRYEAETIDNTKKLVLEGLSEALHVSVEWLRGETEEYETDITDKRELFIRDEMTSILSKLSFIWNRRNRTLQKTYCC